MTARRWIGLGAIGLIGVAVLAAVLLRRSGGGTEVREALARRGRVAVWGDPGLLQVEAPGSVLVDAKGIAPLVAALRGSEVSALVEALRVQRLDALLVRAGGTGAEPSAPLHVRLAAYARLPGVRGLYLAPDLALYAPDPMHDLSEVERAALAGVARGLLAGADPPRVTSFPERLRRVTPVEVMVLLRDGGQARLWRSARGSSIARALVTAASVARKRWIEREQAMGGPIDDALDRLDVEVALLADDGTIGEPSPVFVDRVIGPQHGVAYERKGAWRYLLPDPTHEHPRPSAAYGALLAEDGLDLDRLGSPELRLYRLAVDVIARSPAKRDGASD